MSLDAKNLKEQLNKVGVVSFVPNGQSMWPIFKNAKQSVIVVSAQGQLNRLDVALYSREDGTAVLHRVIEVFEKEYLTCGDGQLSTELVAKENVFGVMQAFSYKNSLVPVTDEKYIKRVEKWYSNPNKRRRKIINRQRLQKLKNFFKKK